MRRTFRGRSPDQYSLLLADGEVRAASEAPAAVRTAFHSAARLSVSAVTSPLESLATCSMVKVGARALTAAASNDPSRACCTGRAWRREVDGGREDESGLFVQAVRRHLAEIAVPHQVHPALACHSRGNWPTWTPP